MRPQIVGVIFSRADLERALRMRKPPDLFELRLDRLHHHLGGVRRAVECLPAPLIVTARHPLEGGSNRLSPAQRRDLLEEFLPHAKYIDVELRSAAFLRAILRSAAAAKRRTILSFHDFASTPSISRLDKIVRTARAFRADIVKVATRTDTPAELDRLLDFFERHRGATTVVAMGIGKLGRVSRLALARGGCVLNYAHLGSPAAPGQLSISEIRRALP